MKTRSSLAIAVAALTIGVPTAAADTGTSATPDWFERAAAAAVRDAGATPYVDALGRPDSKSATLATSPDWFERAAAAAVRDAGATPYVDAFERPTVTGGQEAAPSATESSSSIAWSQLGIGLGLGLALALGVVLALRLKPSRPLAQ